MVKLKNIIFISIAICIGLISAFLVAELTYRFYLFGFRFSYSDNRQLDKKVFDRMEKQIFFVGDSFTRGYPFSLSLSYPMLLEKKLKDRNIKISNFSRVGANMNDQICMIKELSWLAPGLVVWGISANDVADPSVSPNFIPEEASCGSEHYSGEVTVKHPFIRFWEFTYDCIFVVKMGLFSTIKELLNAYSYIYQFLRSYRDIPALRVFKSSKDSNRELCDVSANMIKFYMTDGSAELYLNPFLKTIIYIRDFLNTKNIGFVLLYVPQESDINRKLFRMNVLQFDPDSGKYDYGYPRKIIKEFCLKNKISFIDPCGYMSDRLLAGKSLFMKFDRHYNHAGSDLMAEFLKQDKLFTGYLTEQGQE